MVVESWDRTDCGFTLMVASGYKAGLRHVVLPKDSSNCDNNGIDAGWLRVNWANWVYPECPVRDVLVLPEYDPAVAFQEFLAWNTQEGGPDD